MDAKDKRIAELEKALENAQNNVASPCGYLDYGKIVAVHSGESTQQSGSWNMQKRQSRTMVSLE